jgi:hypothetical protein
MAIALGGRPEESAKIVWSLACMAVLFVPPPLQTQCLFARATIHPDISSERNISRTQEHRDAAPSKRMTQKFPADQDKDNKYQILTQKMACQEQDFAVQY